MNTIKRVEKKFIIPKHALTNVISFFDTKLGKCQYCEYDAVKMQTFYYENPVHLPLYYMTDPSLQLRMRKYNSPAQSSFTWLELKEKNQGLTIKNRLRIEESDIIHLHNKKYILKKLYMHNKECDMQYINVLYEKVISIIQKLNLEKVAFVEYNRISFGNNNIPDLRVTIDSDITTGKKYNLMYRNNAARFQVYQSDILEIKTKHAYPSWLTDFIDFHYLKMTAFSKFKFVIETNCYLKQKILEYV